MAGLSFRWDASRLPGWRQKANNAVSRAARAAGSDAIRAMRTEAARGIRERKAMKAGATLKALPISYPSSKDIGRFQWKLTASGALIPVAAYPHRQTKKGVSVQINKGARSFIKGAFTAQMKSGHYGVFLRKGKGRLPIKEAWTTRVVDVFEDSGFTDRVFARGEQVFRATFARLAPSEFGSLRSVA
jgi:hypothetical protein